MDISLYTDKSCAVAIPYGIGGCEHADWSTHKPWYSANRSAFSRLEWLEVARMR